jgi:alkylhydroperoxidase/carboxymuconolactone decarboxylase family protein YurZ
MMETISAAPGETDAFDIPETLRAGRPEPAGALSAAAAWLGDPARGGLPVRIREIVAVAVLAHMGYAGIESHMRRALAAGASVRELAEALMTISTPGGQRCLAFGLPYLNRLVEELGDIALEPPSEPAAARTSRHAFAAGGEWTWLDENFPDYQECRRQLSRLAFMPESAALPTRYREMLVAVVLSCRPYYTVQEHVDRAIEEGGTFEELVDAYCVGSLFGGASVFSHGTPFLNEVRERIEAGTLRPA